ncbi:MAG: hypothetical protein AAB152_18720 [Candidatus Coatesbacteria bacterium]
MTPKAKTRPPSAARLAAMLPPPPSSYRCSRMGRVASPVSSEIELLAGSRVQ